MTMQSTEKFDEMNDYLNRAKIFNKNGGLHAYLVVLQKAQLDGKIEIVKEVYSAPSFSHVAAMYDHPEEGVGILDVKYMGVGKVSLKPLITKPVADMMETKHGSMDGV